MRTINQILVFLVTTAIFTFALNGCDQSTLSSGPAGTSLGTNVPANPPVQDPTTPTGVPPGLSASPTPPPTTTISGDPGAAVRARVLELTNQYRAQNNLPALKENPKLDAAAEAFAEAMGTESFFDHTAPDGSTPGDRITAAGYTWTAYGENIAEGYHTADDVMTGWMNSAGHKANILNSGFTEIGIGYFIGSSPTLGNNTPFWVQDFATP